MLNKAALADRVKKAKTRHVEMVDKNNWIVEGSDSNYHVRFTDNSPARAVCVERETGEYCKGNSKSVCYHVFAALLARAKMAKAEVSFCANRPDADRLHRIGGTFHRLQNGIGNSEVWFVSVKPVQKKGLESEINRRLYSQVCELVKDLERKQAEMPGSFIVRCDLRKALKAKAQWEERLGIA